MDFEFDMRLQPFCHHSLEYHFGVLEEDPDSMPHLRNGQSTWFGWIGVVNAGTDEATVWLIDEVSRTTTKLVIQGAISATATIQHFFVLNINGDVLKFDLYTAHPVALCSLATPRAVAWATCNKDVEYARGTVRSIIDQDRELSSGELHCEESAAQGRDEEPVPRFMISATKHTLYAVKNGEENEREREATLYKLYDGRREEESRMDPMIIQLSHSEASEQYYSKRRRVESTSENCIRKIVAGCDHIVLLTSAGKVLALGSGNHGELGIGDTTTRTEETVNPDLPVESKIADIAAGLWHSVARTGGDDVYFWGWNRKARLFTEKETEILYSPTPYDLDNVVAIAAADNRTALLVRGQESPIRCGEIVPKDLNYYVE